ncbi:hypothetical protein TNCV_5074011 [Trichonephila clavipes]|nr:hypothetical protein TNCV_5074011 [Trichonephila clavipes]
MPNECDSNQISHMAVKPPPFRNITLRYGLRIRELWRMLFQDQKRMVSLSEEVGEKGFLESRSPTFRIDSSGKDKRRTGFEGPDWRQKA